MRKINYLLILLILLVFSNNLYAQSKNNNPIKFLLGTSFFIQGITNEATEKSPYTSTANKFSAVRSLDLKDKTEGVFYGVNTKFGAEFFKSLDFYADLGFGNLTSWQNIKYTDANNETFTDRFLFQYTFFEWDINARYTYYFRNPKSITDEDLNYGIYVGAGFGAIIPFGFDPVYQNQKNSKHGTTMFNYENGEKLDIFRDGINNWQVKGSAGLMLRGFIMGAGFFKTYIGYEIKYFWTNIYGEDSDKVFYAREINTSNTQIYKITLPELHLLHGVTLGFDYIF